MPVSVKNYEVLFALRTGVTVLLPKMPELDAVEKSGAATFQANGSDIVVSAAGRQLISIAGMKPNHIASAVQMGFIMLYETEKDEVVRNALCKLAPRAGG